MHNTQTHPRSIRLRRKDAIACAAGLAASLLTGTAAASPFQVDTIAATGLQVPGDPPGVTWAEFQVPTVSDTGEIFVRASDTAQPLQLRTMRSLWTGTPGNLRSVMRIGDEAPGWPTPATLTGARTGYRDLGDGQTVFTSAVDANDHIGTDTSLWLHDGTDTRYIVRPGMTPPDAPAGTTLSPIGDSHSRAAQNGRLVFTGELRDSNNTRQAWGIWQWSDGELATVAIQGQQLSGGPSGTIVEAPHAIGGARNNLIKLSRDGITAFRADLTGQIEGRALLLGPQGDVGILAHEGQRAPGTPSDVTFAQQISTPLAMNNQNRVLFSAELDGPGITPDNASSLWIGGADGVDLIARAGEPVPGLPSTVTWHTFPSSERHASQAGEDRLAFVAETKAQFHGTGRGVWAGTTEELNNLAMVGSQAPGLDPGIEFTGFSEVLTNARGHVALLASVGDPHASGSAGSLWAADTDGILELIVKAGQEIEVAPGDFREIASITNLLHESPEDGVLGSLNNDGLLAFRVLFDDGTQGVFQTVIPAPGTLGLLALAGLAAVRRRRG